MNPSTKNFALRKLTNHELCAVQWNQAHTNYIAHGIERQRGAPGLMIWDVNESGTDHHRHRGTRSTISDNSTVSSSIGSAAHHIASGGSIQIGGMVAETVYKPAFEYAVNESVFSVAWMPDAPKNVLAGCSKVIRVYDIRDHASSRSKSTHSFNAHSKNVLGLQFNPFDARILASYGSDEVHVKIWDMRNMSEPFTKRRITTSSTPSNRVVHIEWSQCEKNILVTLTTEGDRIKFWSIPGEAKKSTYVPMAFKFSSYKNIYPLDADRISSSGVVESSSQPQNPQQHAPEERVVTFSMSPTLPRHVLIGTPSLVKHVQIETHSPQFACSPFGDVTMSFDGSGFETRSVSALERNDISDIMCIRAKKNVGMNFQTNLTIAREIDDKNTIPLWEWATRLKKLNQLDGRQDERTFIYVGVRSILRFDKKKRDRKLTLPFLNFGSNGMSSPSTPLTRGNSSGSSSTSASANDNPPLRMQSISTIDSKTGTPISALNSVTKNADSVRIRSSFRVFEDDKRTVAMTLCGWHDGNHNIFTKNDYISERDAAIAIFQLDLTKAADILTKLDNGTNNYSMLAFALYGFLEERRTAFRNASASLTNPYLRAAFGFLSSENHDFSPVLQEEGIHLSDRTAFACMYLPDDALLQYVDSQSDLATREGDLEGILLTGLSKRGLTLMQNFVNNSNDIQTACLAFSHVVPLRFKDDQVEMWLHNYRELLDSWQFWERRAVLDTTLSYFTRSSIQQQNPGVVIRCTYCQHPLLTSHQQRVQKKVPGIGQRFASSMRGAYPTVAPTATTCPNCKKALPKCSICLTPYGTSMRSLGETQDNAWNPHLKLDYCFAWCRTCKHGGHVKHLLEWFADHDLCPVSGCSCACNTTNPASQMRKRNS
eukprot:CAMPEP_0117446122 /NCGR_PEP_ID=MMETSP0759-20121206/6162_1 /TAXON_ID=63605 /ORGANISM="Percolomonas cosmopolitus, Strain WS" /LENGTH=881 /DNA_ID=CAMNT_0005238347 /DNA_START=485 /DNA_END=3129 /DNA_ORIENTATION=-